MTNFHSILTSDSSIIMVFITESTLEIQGSKSILIISNKLYASSLRVSVESKNHLLSLGECERLFKILCDLEILYLNLIILDHNDLDPSKYLAKCLVRYICSLHLIKMLTPRLPPCVAYKSTHTNPLKQ